MEIAKLVRDRKGSIHCCNRDTTVAEAARLLAEHRIGALPVVVGDEVVGIFSERDLLYCVAQDGAGALDHQVGDVMTSPPVTVTRDTDALEALSLMTRRRIRHLPVVENGRMIGFISIGDLVKLRVEEAEAEAAAMRVYIQSA